MASGRPLRGDGVRPLPHAKADAPRWRLRVAAGEASRRRGGGGRGRRRRRQAGGGGGGGKGGGGKRQPRRPLRETTSSGGWCSRAPGATSGRLRGATRSSSSLCSTRGRTTILQSASQCRLAHSLNRTLVLPVWLPRRRDPEAALPPGRAAAAGVATAASTKRRTPSSRRFEPEPLEKYVRTIALKDFRALTDGKLERCLTDGGLAHAGASTRTSGCRGWTRGNNYTETDSRGGRPRAVHRALPRLPLVRPRPGDARATYASSSILRVTAAATAAPATAEEALLLQTTSSSTGSATSTSRRSGRSTP